MRHSRIATVMLTLALAHPTAAGVLDSPLPELLAGQTTLHVFTVPGIIATGGIGSFFNCTSLDTVTMQVGVELFPAPGGAPINDTVATSLSLAPGATVIFGTSAAVGISISSSLGGLFSKGSARILSTSKKLGCNAFMADTSNDPPTSMAQLTVITKTKQKAFN